MSVRSTIVALGALATSVVAHGTVKSFTIDGKENQGFLLDYYYAKQNGQSTPDIAAWYAENLDNGFVGPEAYSTSDINCHKNSEPGKLTAKVAAGGKVTFNWGEWPHGIGPVLTYVAECGGDCAQVDKTALKWVKIDAEGHDGKTWAAQKLIDDGGKWTTTVPANLKAGNYVFRHEIIALHGGGDKNGAQNYPQCANIEVTGSGSELPEGTLGTDLYKADDKGILFNPYGPTIDYTIPGPALFGSSGSGSGNSAPAPAPTSAAPSTPSATAAPATGNDGNNNDDDECEAEDVDAAADEDDECEAEDVDGTEDDECEAEDVNDGADEDDECDAPEPSAPAPAPAPTTLVTSARPAATPAPGSGAGAPLYAQCGGNGFTGPTTCAAGTCTKMNDWYSQCVN